MSAKGKRTKTIEGIWVIANTALQANMDSNDLDQSMNICNNMNTDIVTL